MQLTSAGKVSMLVRPPNPPLIIKPGTETTIAESFVDFHCY